MALNLRQRVHDVVDELPEDDLKQVLHFVELMRHGDTAAVEIEERWLLVSGALKRMVDETGDAPAPTADWRGHLRGL